VTTAQLAFCIPTYKRPDQLVACVRSIIQSGARFGVPIHIADDSTDETNVAAIAAVRAEYPHVVHHRNERNLGIDGNILHCVDVCDARYAWIMGARTIGSRLKRYPRSSTCSRAATSHSCT
jgi:glycosyltransferase involved in cell wall biosynthesis